jgi:KDO2-lipid IV(A) lauroyltransferase
MRLFATKYNQRFTTFLHNSINDVSLVNTSMKQVLLNGLLMPKIWLKPHKIIYSIADDLDSQREWSELLERQNNQQGTLILTPHLGLFEFIPRLIALNHKPFFALYKPSRKAWVHKMLEIGRNFPNIQMCPANVAGVKKMVQALKKGQISGLLPDQVPTDGEGVMAPFFGKPAKTMVLPFRLAKMANVPLVWVIVIPKVHERFFDNFFKPLEVTIYFKKQEVTSEDQVIQATQMNQAIEQWVTQFPTHYLWSYNRYK